MAFIHHKWEKNNRKLYNSETGQYQIRGRIGENQTPDGSGGFLPFILHGATNEIQHGADEARIEFASDKQVLKVAADTICSSFKLFVQADINGEWVNQPHGAPVRSFRQNEVFRDGGFVSSEGKCTGFLTFPDAHLSFGGNKPYDLYVGLEAGRGNIGKLGFRFRVPRSGTMRFEIVLDGVKKLPADWEWLWSGTGLPINPIENRKRGIRVKDFEWKWSYAEAPFRDIVKEDNPDGTMKISIILGPYTVVADEWLTIYPDAWQTDYGIQNNDDDGQEMDSVPSWNEDGYGGGGYNYFGSDGSQTGGPGYRWRTVGVPEGATIDSPTAIYYYATLNQNGFNGSPQGDLWGVHGDAPLWASGVRPSNTCDTIAFTPHDPTGGTGKRTIDAQDIVQEIIDGAWTEDDNMGFGWIRTSGVGDHYRESEDYSNSNDPPEITITYTPAGGDTFYQAAGQGAVAPTGILSTKATFARTVGSHAMSIAGVLSKKTTPVTAMGGHSMSIAGVLSKKTTPVTAMGGHAMTIIGSLTKAITIGQDTGGHAMTIVGALTTIGTFVRAVGGHAMTIVGTLVKKTSTGVGAGQVASAGVLSKKTSKDVGGGSVTSIGTLATAIMYMQAVGGASMSIVGSLATQFIAGTGVVAKFIRRRKTFYKQ